MEFVCKFISSYMDESYIHRNTNILVDDKSYIEDMLDDCFDKFFDAKKEYETNYDSDKFFYKVKLKDDTITVVFDKRNIYHLFGFPNYRKIVEAVVMRDVLFDKYKVNKEKENCDDILISRIKNKDHLQMLSEVFKGYALEIKNFDCDEANKEEYKLNWDKILFKVFCFLNIGDLTDKTQENVYYIKNVKKGENVEILLKKDLILDGNREYSLTIQLLKELVPNSDNKYVYSPKSIRIEKIPRAFSFERKGSGETFKFGGKVELEQKNGSMIKCKMKEVK